jgi:hypothetical protein
VTELNARLQSATESAEALRSRTARWQIVLGDGVADLQSESDHELRVRIRSIIQEAESALDQSDPAKIWDEFAGWLADRVAYDVTEVYLSMTDRAESLVAEVAEMFATDAASVHQLAELDLADDLVSSIFNPELPAAALERGSVASAISLMRNTYSSVSMLGSMGSMVGMIATGASLNPFTLGIGLLLGGRTVMEERTRKVEGRRGQAKAAVRKYTDEVSLVAGKDMRDAVRNLQRGARDTFSARAEELTKAAAAAVREAQAAAQTGAKDRQEKAVALQRRLEALQSLGAQLQALAPGAT